MPPAEARALFGDEGDGAWRIVGHKWFFSAPQCDAHLILAQTDEGSAGLSCFFLPRYLPDGSRNAIRVQRLKDKLGNRSNASSEVEFTDAYGWLVGQPGRGIPTILEMASHTRLDCVLGSAGIMRAALTHALHHARQRAAFGKPLAEQPLMQNVLADLALESEAATAFALRLARCFDARRRSGASAAGAHPDAGRQILDLQARPGLRRRGDGGAWAATATWKTARWRACTANCPSTRSGKARATSCAWTCLRAFGKSPAARDALAAELALAGDGDAAFAAYRARAAGRPGRAADATNSARASWPSASCWRCRPRLLLRHAPPFVAQAFVRRACVQASGGAYGRLPAGVDCAAILARALREY